jgi:Tfp pilus assembly protein PilN
MSTPIEEPVTLTLPPLIPPPGIVTDRSLRIPPIMANLLPLEIVDARRDRRMRRVVLAALASFVAVLVAWYALSAYQTRHARQTLAAAQQSGEAVLRQQRAFAEVVDVQAESKLITTQLAALLGTDLQWAKLLGAVESSAPAGVALTGMTGSITPTADAAAATAVTLPNTTGLKAVGSLTVSGSATSQATIAAYVDALARITGLGNPLLSGVTTQNGQLQFSVRLDITSAALGGRYAISTGSAGGSASGGGSAGGN